MNTMNIQILIIRVLKKIGYSLAMVIGSHWLITRIFFISARMATCHCPSFTEQFVQIVHFLWYRKHAYIRATIRAHLNVTVRTVAWTETRAQCAPRARIARRNNATHSLFTMLHAGSSHQLGLLISVSMLILLMILLRYWYWRYFHVEVSKAVSIMLLQPFLLNFDIDTF